MASAHFKQNFYMLGLKSMEQEGKFHFVRNQGNTKLILSKPQSQPTSNLQNTDSRLFEVLSSTEDEKGSIILSTTLQLDCVMKQLIRLSPTATNAKYF